MDGYVLGLGFGMIAALMMNVGKGVQKQKVRVLTKGREILAPQNRRDFAIWSMGLLLTVSSTLPFSLGLKLSKSPSAISAMTGIGLIGLVIYAVKVIGEPVDTRDRVGIAAVVVGTSVLGYLGGGTASGRQFADLALALTVISLLLIGGIACLAARRWPRMHGVAYGATAGICIGIALFLGDAALVRSDGSLTDQLRNPYPYLALLIAAAATVITQFGFLKGRALEVVPAVNTAIILIPIILEGVIYGALPSATQLGLTLVVLTGVILLSTGAAARASG